MMSERSWIASAALIMLCVLAHADPPKQDPKKLLVGTWEAVTAKGLHVEFTADGHFTETGDTPSQGLKGTYRWVDQTTIELILDAFKETPGLLGISFVGDQLGIADPPTKHGKPVKPEPYKRIK